MLPGIGPIPTIAMLLPITFGLDPLSSLIMLAGIYYGAQYGGSTTSILVNIPGEAGSIVTCIDGHQMAKQGRAGAALGVAALGSFFAGCVGTVFIAAFGPPLAAIAQEFNSPDYFSLMVLGLVTAVVLAHGSVIKAIGMVLVGLLFGLVGTDVNSGLTRYTFGVSELWDGIDFLPLVIGLFGIVEIIRNLEQRAAAARAGLRADCATSGRACRTSGLLARGAARHRPRLAPRHPARRRRGACGVRELHGGEEDRRATRRASARARSRAWRVRKSANNAAAQTSFIPLLTLGLPSNAIMALMMGAMIIQGIQPGSAVMTKRPDLFWGMVASMWIGNLMLLVINLPLIGIWVRLLSVPYRLLYPAILLFCVIGIYATNTNFAQMVMTAVFALFGYILLKFDCEPAPLVLGFILGPLMEENLRRSLVISRGDPMIFLERPISAMLLALTVRGHRADRAAADPQDARGGVSGVDWQATRKARKKPLHIGRNDMEITRKQLLQSAGALALASRSRRRRAGAGLSEPGHPPHLRVSARQRRRRAGALFRREAAADREPHRDRREQGRRRRQHRDRVRRARRSPTATRSTSMPARRSPPTRACSRSRRSTSCATSASPRRSTASRSCSWSTPRARTRPSPS